MRPLAAFASQNLRLFFFFTVCLTRYALAVECKIAQPHPVSEAEQAYLKGNYDQAETLYQQQLQQNPNDAHLTVGMVQVLLQQQKVKEADEIVHKSIAADPQSAPLLTALAEIQYREGTPWLASSTVRDALKLDPCYAKLHLFSARLYRVSSFYGSAATQLNTAHALDPHDPATRLLWLNTLPPSQRIAELDSYLATATGDSPEELARLHFYLDHLKKQADEPHKACRLISNTATTSIDFSPIMRDATHIRAFGLDAKLNDRSARLQIDTGASGLLVSRSVAERAGLKRFSNEEVGGIGSEGQRSAYTAYADDIKVGSLEFRDCLVEVIDKRNVLDMDGLIGMDVFSRFLVTLDYPMRKLILGPLPQRPEDTAPRTPTLETASSGMEEDATTAVGKNQPADSTAKAVTRAAHDRYIAPEMKDWAHVYRVGHNLLIPASLNGSSQKLFVLDTGAFTTTISPNVARELTRVYSADGGLEVHGVSGKVDKVYTADNITFQFANLVQKAQEVVSFDTSHLSKSLGLEVSGFLGITTLGQTAMSIDYRDGLVKFAYDAHRGYAYPTSR